jgi:hypothetical protein
MNIPTIAGTIDRRILINYQVEKEVLEKFLPAPFTPKLVQNKGIAGICLIRLKNIRPKGAPLKIGISSENGAHRIAVQWQEKGVWKEGVYIPRRDTSSRLNSIAGGRIFPGVHHLAKFHIKEFDNAYDIEFTSNDGTHLSIKAEATNEWSTESIFVNQTSASDFFRNGSLGYSPDKTGESFEGLELETQKWQVSALKVSFVKSSFFENKSVFPAGSLKFDNALLMKDIEHEWKARMLVRP